MELYSLSVKDLSSSNSFLRSLIFSAEGSIVYSSCSIGNACRSGNWNPTLNNKPVILKKKTGQKYMDIMMTVQNSMKTMQQLLESVKNH